MLVRDSKTSLPTNDRDVGRLFRYRGQDWKVCCLLYCPLSCSVIGAYALVVLQFNSLYTANTSNFWDICGIKAMPRSFTSTAHFVYSFECAEYSIFISLAHLMIVGYFVYNVAGTEKNDG